MLVVFVSFIIVNCYKAEDDDDSRNKKNGNVMM